MVDVVNCPLEVVGALPLSPLHILGEPKCIPSPHPTSQLYAVWQFRPCHLLEKTTDVFSRSPQFKLIPIPVPLDYRLLSFSFLKVIPLYRVQSCASCM